MHAYNTGQRTILLVYDFLRLCLDYSCMLYIAFLSLHCTYNAIDLVFTMSTKDSRVYFPAVNLGNGRLNVKSHPWSSRWDGTSGRKFLDLTPMLVGVLVVVAEFLIIACFHNWRLVIRANFINQIGGTWAC